MPGESPGRIRTWFAAVALAAVAVYAPTIGHGFVFDDGIVIERNLDVRSLANIPDIFRHSEWEGGGLENHLYRPLTSTTYALNYAISGLRPWSYHVGNVLLHALASLLVLSLGLRWRLPLEAAGVGALLFAVHPVHVEAVANVVGRKEVLATIFLVLMFVAHGRAVARGAGSIVLPPVAYACAMLSKEVGVVGIGLVALGDLILSDDAERAGSGHRRRAVLYATYGLLLVGFVAVHRAVVGALPAESILEIDNPAARAATVVRWMTALAVAGKGLALQFLPVSQSPDYSFAALPLAESALDPRIVGAVLAFGAWVGYGVRSRAFVPAVLLGAGWYGLSLLPASNLLFATGTIFGERLLYAPSVGLALLVGWLVHLLVGRRSSTAVTAVAVVLGGALSIGTLRYGAAWRDDYTLFSRASRSAPNSAKVHHLLGQQLFYRGAHEEAERALRRSLDIWPDGHHSLRTLGDLFLTTGRPGEAAEMYRAALELDPGDADALYGLGRLSRDTGDLETAERLWLEAVASNPRQGGALSDLGSLAYTRGDRTAALDYWDRAVLYEPGQASAWYNLGMVRGEMGDREGSVRAYREFLRTAGPEYAQAAREVESLLGR